MAVVKSEPSLSPVPSSVPDCLAFYWQGVAFSPGGDVVCGLLGEKLLGWVSLQLGWVVDSRSDMPFARPCPIDIVKPRDDDAHSSDGNCGGAIKRDPAL